MDTRRKEILELIKLMAWNTRTVEYAQYYLEGPGKYASPKELTLHVIELMTQDGSAMGFEPGDDIGDIVECLDDIAEHFHLLLSGSWFSEEDGLTGWLKALGERWGRNGVRVLYIEDPKEKVLPIYVVEEGKVSAILAQAQKAEIPICGVEELDDDADEEEDEAIDWTLG